MYSISRGKSKRNNSVGACRLPVGHDTPTSPRESSCSCEREKKRERQWRNYRECNCTRARGEMGPSSSSSKKWDKLIGQIICFNMKELTGPAVQLMTARNTHMIQSHQFANISQLWCQLFIIMSYHLPNKHVNNSQF